MSLNNDKIAIVEVGGSHDECILTQLSALKKGGKEVVLICTEDVAKRNMHFADYIVSTVLIETKGKSKGAQAKAIWRSIKSANVAKVVFNTAQGGVIRNVCLKALFSKVEFIGIIHTTRKFEGSFTQKIINRKIKKYLLLSQFLHDKILAPKGIKTDYFYPIAYPQQNNFSDDTHVIVAILGGVEQRRKDLDGFIQMVQQISVKDVEFVFLGKSDPQLDDVKKFRVKLKDGGLTDKVKLYDHFVSQKDFDALLSKASFILPLVHPNTPSADQYFKNQISGATNVAFGYNIPLLIHEGYHHVHEMNAGSFYYNLENFDAILKQAIENRQEKVNALELDYTVLEQEQRYFNFLFG